MQLYRCRRAYEIKLRVTIAASGQGRWREELAFPQDCQASGYTPVLVVLDPTLNPKLQELGNAFIRAGGEAYTGQAAWEHLKATAGPIMARFLELYVHTPIQSLLRDTPARLPEVTFRMDEEQFTATIGEEVLIVRRDRVSTEPAEEEELPPDVDQLLPGL